MQTDILLKQLNSSLEELKATIEKFEKNPSPSTHQAEQLYTAISNSNKLVSAFLVLKEKKDVAHDLDLHIKLMAVPTKEEKAIIADVEAIIEPKTIEERELPKVEPVAEVKPVEPISNNVAPVIQPAKKEYPKIAININDKFRFINELFKINSKEYEVAIEQLNTVNSMDEANAYLRGLKTIYNWDDENEMVKKLYVLVQKRFA